MFSNRHSRNKMHPGWTLLVGIVLAALLLSGCASASTPRVYRVGILSGLDLFADIVDGFKAKMTELGYVEGKNIVYDLQKTNFEPDKEQQILKKFVDDKVDLIFVFPTEVAMAAKAAAQGSTVPVLFANAFIEGVDLVKSVREPGGNITGVRFPGPDIAAKRFEIFHELASQAKRMLIPYQRSYPSVPSQLEALRSVAASAGVTLVELPADNLAEVEADLQARAKSSDISFDAILCISEPLVTTPDALVILGKFSAGRKVPIGGCPIPKDGYGSLFMLVPDDVAVGKQAAPLADKILKGISAGTIPVVSPEPVLRFNYKQAQELGLTVPEGILKQANEIIK
jgi:putative tryptophan/tyrosine transport system substrate-binding protein